MLCTPRGLTIIIILFKFTSIKAEEIVIVSPCNSHLYTTESFAQSFLSEGFNVTYITSKDCEKRVRGFGADVYNPKKWEKVVKVGDSVGWAALMNVMTFYREITDIAIEETLKMLEASAKKPDAIFSDFFIASCAIVAEKFNIPYATLYFTTLDSFQVSKERAFLASHVGIDDNSNAVTHFLSEVIFQTGLRVWSFGCIEKINTKRKQLGLMDEFNSDSHLLMSYPTFTLLSPKYQRSSKGTSINLGIFPRKLHTETTKLNEEITEFIKKSNKDILYISFGSELRPSEDILESLVKYLSQQNNYDIIFARYPFKKMQAPANILAQDYVAQRSLLRSPRVKIFLSHCGLNSLIEAIESETVLICLPLGRDQFFSSFGVVNAGIGVNISYPVTEKSIVDAFQEVHTEYDKFRRTIKREKEELYGMNGVSIIKQFISENANRSTRIYKEDDFTNFRLFFVCSVLFLVLCIPLIACFACIICVRKRLKKGPKTTKRE